MLHLLLFTRKCALKQLHLWHLMVLFPALQGWHNILHSYVLMVRSYVHPFTLTLHVSSGITTALFFSHLNQPPSRSMSSIKSVSGFSAHNWADATCFCMDKRELISLTHYGRSEKTKQKHLSRRSKEPATHSTVYSRLAHSFLSCNEKLQWSFRGNGGPFVKILLLNLVVKQWKQWIVVISLLCSLVRLF